MKAQWVFVTVLSDGRKRYIERFINSELNHHTTIKGDAARFTTEQKNKILKTTRGYNAERILKGER